MLSLTYLNGAEAKSTITATTRSHIMLHNVSCGITPVDSSTNGTNDTVD